MPRNAPLVLIVRDGWGENPNPDHDPFNAVKLAKTPVADRLMQEYSTTLIHTSGEDVGLPAGVMGNSEVGHQNIGAGRVVDQEVMRITRAVRDGSFFENPALNGAFEHVQKTGGLVHLLGLVSDGQVHSDLDHLLALIDLAAQREVPDDRLLVHAITDGRDTAPKGGLGYVERVLAKLSDAGVGRIGSVMGRYYAMDRDNRWDRVALAWNCLTGRGETRAASSEANRTGDEFIVPARIGDDVVSDGDAIIFFNFRGDRPREITRAFMLEDQDWAGVTNGGFERGPRLENLYYCGMTRYERGLPMTAVAFEKPPKMANILGDLIARAGLTQFRCAETEKYPHVTFFFNDYREEPFEGESRLLVPSPKEVSTYDQKPEMSAHGVCDGVVDRLRADDSETLIVVNFANGDMVGHTGNLEAATRAVEVTDECVGRIAETTLARGGALIITADHGNAEQMWDPGHDCPHTAHTTYDVVLMVVGSAFKGQALRDGGRLADIAPTVLAILGLEPPPEMTGTSLLAAQPAAAPRS
jgi:2,3-bisphosphoglycerate-independent phosphoglycerate mutase